MMLVGGLSAAATSLAWAALWGPLAHPAPSVVVVSNPGAADVLVVGVPSGRQHGHTLRRPRHTGGSHATPPPVPSLKLRTVTGGGPHDGTSLVRNDRTPLVPSDNQDSVPPQSPPGRASRFRLAINMWPGGQTQRQDADDGPVASGGASSSGDDSTAPSTTGTTDAAADAQQDLPEAKHPSAVRHPQRHRRRHARRGRQGKAHADNQPLTTPAVVPDAAAGEADASPKTRGKPID